ncbi:TniQ family protein [Bradyrhizobium embrapense]
MLDSTRPSIRPEVGESIHSMVLRLAPLFMMSTNDFVQYALHIAGTIHLVVTRIEALWRMAELAGWNPVEIEARLIERTTAGMMIYQREVPSEWVDLRTRRVAPGVLASDETPYHRISWHVPAIECDLASGEVLVDRCPRCEAILGWSNVESVFACGACEFDIREHKPSYVPEDLLRQARGFHAFLDGTADRLPSQLQALDNISKAYAMEWLAYFVDLPIGRCLKPSFRNAAGGLVEAKRWPESFDHVMDRFLASAPHLMGIGTKAEMVSQLMSAIDRAGTPPLRQILVNRAISILSKSSLSGVTAGSRIFRAQRDIRRSEGAPSQPLSVGEVMRMDSMRAIQSATSRSPFGIVGIPHRSRALVNEAELRKQSAGTLYFGRP